MRRPSRPLAIATHPQSSPQAREVYDSEAVIDQLGEKKKVRDWSQRIERSCLGGSPQQSCGLVSPFSGRRGTGLCWLAAQPPPKTSEPATCSDLTWRLPEGYHERLCNDNDRLCVFVRFIRSFLAPYDENINVSRERRILGDDR